MRTRPWFSLLAALALAACAHAESSLSGQEPGPERRLSDFMPLAVGNSWVYQTEFQGQPQADLEVKLVRQEEGAFVDNRPVPTYYIIDAEGIRDGARRYLLKAPVRKGTRWMSVADVRTVEHYEIVAVERKVSVPAGDFSGCAVVQMEVRLDEKRTMRNYMTFAPGVGVVEIETVLRQGSQNLPQARLRLKSYRLQSSPQ